MSTNIDRAARVLQWEEGTTEDEAWLAAEALYVAGLLAPDPCHQTHRDILGDVHHLATGIRTGEGILDSPPYTETWDWLTVAAPGDGTVVLSYEGDLLARMEPDAARQLVSALTAVLAEQETPE